MPKDGERGAQNQLLLSRLINVETLRLGLWYGKDS